MQTYMALLCRILHSLMVHCRDEACACVGLLSCLFLSECQLLLDRKTNLRICFWRLWAPSARCSQHQQEVQTCIFYHVSTLCNLDSIPDQTVNRNIRLLRVGTLEMQFSHGSILITREISLFFLSTLKRPWKRFYFNWVALLQRKEQKYVFLLRKKKVGPSLFRICVEWDVWRFVWVSLLFCIYYINIYININCCTLHSEPSLHACGFPPSPNAFCFSVWISWWIHSCFCLMKANSCNMQELWPGNKNDCTCAASVMCRGSTGAELDLQDHT